MMPAQPAGDRVGIGADEKHVLPRYEDIVEPHLAVELVISGGQRRDERVRVARGTLAAQNRDPGRADRDDEPGAMAADIDARQAADINVLRIGGARVHAELAAYHNP